jgi:ketosteroid isomerase-like protein
MGRDDENAALARRLWTAVAEGDPDTLRKFLAPRAVWRAYGANPLSGEYRGADGVIEYLASVGELVDRLRLSLHGIFSNDDGAIIDLHVSARRAERQLEVDFLLTLRIADGEVVEARTIAVDQLTNDAFWAAEPLGSAGASDLD